LATAGDDEKAILWGVKTGRQISAFPANAIDVYKVAFSSDGERLATSWGDGTIRLYLSQPAKLVQKGLARIDNPLLKLDDCEYLDSLRLRKCRPFLLIAAAKDLMREGEARRDDAVLLFRKVLAGTKIAEAVIDSQALLKGLDLDPALANNPDSAAQTWLTNEVKSLAKDQAWSGDLQGLTASLEFLKDLDPQYSAKTKEIATNIVKRRVRTLVQRGNLEEVEKNYQQLLALNPESKFDPEDRARQEIAKALIYKAETFVRQKKVEDALTTLEEAKKLHSAVKISDEIYAELCWSGVLEDKAQLVLEACEISVKNNPEHGGMRDSRGVARAMTGNLEGVIQDFKHYVEWAPSRDRPQARIDRRKRWIEQLDNGKNPFSGPNREKVIAELKDE
jgi:tetratricopeptide (TPR) repeat protein